MPDIALCTNQECPFRNRCYRNRAVSSEWQAYFPFKPTEGKCDDFIEIEKHHKIKEKDDANT